jgi:predicted ester cyclase
VSTDQNKELVIRWLEERNKGNWDRINELFAPEYVCHLASDPDPVRGRDKVRQMNVMLKNGFEIFPTQQPDLLIAEGDLVVHRETVRLKPRDPWRGIPPTEKEAIVASVDIYRILDGKIVEQWSHPHLFGRMQQLGNFDPVP